jgi:hypothetical protein
MATAVLLRSPSLSLSPANPADNALALRRPQPNVATDYAALGAESEVGHLALKGLGIGGVIGAIVGAGLVGIASFATEVVLPGSFLHGAGPLLEMIVGAGAGAMNGGLVGALIGWGIPVEVDLAGAAADKAAQEQFQPELCASC